MSLGSLVIGMQCIEGRAAIISLKIIEAAQPMPGGDVGGG